MDEVSEKRGVKTEIRMKDTGTRAIFLAKRYFRDKLAELLEGGLNLTLGYAKTKASIVSLRKRSRFL